MCRRVLGEDLGQLLSESGKERNAVLAGACLVRDVLGIKLLMEARGCVSAN